MYTNHGLYWNNTDLRTIRTKKQQGWNTKQIAIYLGRNTSAVARMEREIVRMDMMMHGSTTDTLRSWRKKLETLQSR